MAHRGPDIQVAGRDEDPLPTARCATSADLGPRVWPSRRVWWPYTPMDDVARHRVRSGWTGYAGPGCVVAPTVAGGRGPAATRTSAYGSDTGPRPSRALRDPNGRLITVVDCKAAGCTACGIAPQVRTINRVPLRRPTVGDRYGFSPRAANFLFRMMRQGSWPPQSVATVDR